MAQYGHLSALDLAECRQLLAAHQVGRVAWDSTKGLQVLPVNYTVVDDVIVVRTEADSILAELAEPRPVAFQIDDLDVETATGWTVLAQGTSGAAVPSLPGEGPRPWAPGDRRLVVGLAVDSYSGRSVAATDN